MRTVEEEYPTPCPFEAERTGGVGEAGSNRILRSAVKGPRRERRVGFGQQRMRPVVFRAAAGENCPLAAGGGERPQQLQRGGDPV